MSSTFLTRSFLTRANINNPEIIRKLFDEYLKYCRDSFEDEDTEELIELNDETEKEFISRFITLPSVEYSIEDFMVDVYYFDDNVIEEYDYTQLRKEIFHYLKTRTNNIELEQVGEYILDRRGLIRALLYMEVEYGKMDLTSYYTKNHTFCYCVKKYEKEHCCVCLEDKKNYRTGCGHFVCVVCNEKLKGNCPICRSEKSNECKTCSGLDIRETFTKGTYQKTPINIP